MCLAVLALNQHPRYGLVLVANRDEFHARPSSALASWALASGATVTTVFSGRDEQAGGTWLGATASGRIALLTNVRRPWVTPPKAPSRGHLVTDWLASTAPAEPFWQQAAARGCAPFNLLMGDLSAGAADDAAGADEGAHANTGRWARRCAGRWFWGSNVGGGADGLAPAQRWLAPSGLFGLSNAALETPWPKLVRLKAAVAQALQAHGAAAETSEAATLPALSQALWLALAERRRSPDAELPQTGVSLELERMLSSIFIDDGRGVYGTRCSSVLLVERAAALGQPRQAHLLERRFAPGGALLGQTQLSWALA
jgi:uncharacterized protein with NRDE domain